MSTRLPPSKSGTGSLSRSFKNTSKVRGCPRGPGEPKWFRPPNIFLTRRHQGTRRTKSEHTTRTKVPACGDPACTRHTKPALGRQGSLGLVPRRHTKRPPSTGGHFQREAALAKREKKQPRKDEKNTHPQGGRRWEECEEERAEHKATPPSVGASHSLHADAAEADAAAATYSAARADAATAAFSGSSAGSTEVVRVPERAVISNSLCLQLAYGRQPMKRGPEPEVDSFVAMRFANRNMQM